MPLCPSGTMSLGGSDAPRSVNCELGLSGTAAICMDAAAVRCLAGRPGAGCAICMADFYGKSSTPCPPALGGVYQGGYYMGAVSSPANYYIIVAPNATGCIGGLSWKTTRTASANTGSVTDGYANTRNGLTGAIHPAGNWTATRSIGGFSDWYLPARDELNLIYGNRNSLPAGQESVTCIYWSSTQSSVENACGQSFSSGLISFNSKDASYSFRVRATRRQFFSDSRLKTNIKVIGTIENINIYEYNYLWEPTKYKGVMAQELLGTKYSDSVIEDESGFYKVDYSKLPDRFQEFIFN